MPSATPRTRLSAEQRRPQIVDAAITEFALAGLAGTSTESIARRAGISHAYLFRLFPTKRDLFMAAIDRAYGHILQTFQAAYQDRDPSEPVFKVLGESYVRLIEDRKELLFQFQALAACGDDDIRARVRERYGQAYDWVKRTTGADDDLVRLFMATGALLDIGTATGDPRLLEGGGSWSARVRGGHIP